MASTFSKPVVIGNRGMGGKYDQVEESRMPSFKQMNDEKDGKDHLNK